MHTSEMSVLVKCLKPASACKVDNRRNLSQFEQLYEPCQQSMRSCHIRSAEGREGKHLRQTMAHARTSKILSSTEICRDKKSATSSYVASQSYASSLSKRLQWCIAQRTERAGAAYRSNLQSQYPFLVYASDVVGVTPDSIFTWMRSSVSSSQLVVCASVCPAILEEFSFRLRLGLLVFQMQMHKHKQAVTKCPR